jgi:hypothetical protein
MFVKRISLNLGKRSSFIQKAGSVALWRASFYHIETQQRLLIGLAAISSGQTYQNQAFQPS